MKKSIILLVVLLLSVQLWAISSAGSLKNYLEIGGDYSLVNELVPVETSSGTTRSGTLKTHSAGPSIAFGTKFSARSRWSANFNVAFLFPFSLIVNVGDKTAPIPLNTDESYFMTTANIGFLHNFIDTPRFILSGGPGVNFIFAFINAKSSKTFTLYYGPSATLNAKIFFTDRIYLGLGAIVAYNLLHYTIATKANVTESGSGIVSNFSVQPRLSVGFKL